jgi:hypothetical protein
VSAASGQMPQLRAPIPSRDGSFDLVPEDR